MVGGLCTPEKNLSQVGTGITQAHRRARVGAWVILLEHPSPFVRLLGARV